MFTQNIWWNWNELCRLTYAYLWTKKLQTIEIEFLFWHFVVVTNNKSIKWEHFLYSKLWKHLYTWLLYRLMCVALFTILYALTMIIKFDLVCKINIMKLKFNQPRCFPCRYFMLWENMQMCRWRLYYLLKYHFHCL